MMLMSPGSRIIQLARSRSKCQDLPSNCAGCGLTLKQLCPFGEMPRSKQLPIEARTSEPKCLTNVRFKPNSTTCDMLSGRYSLPVL